MAPAVAAAAPRHFAAFAALVAAAATTKGAWAQEPITFDPSDDTDVAPPPELLELFNVSMGDDGQIAGAEEDEQTEGEGNKDPDAKSTIYYFTSANKCVKSDSSYIKLEIDGKYEVKADCSSCSNWKGLFNVVPRSITFCDKTDHILMKSYVGQDCRARSSDYKLNSNDFENFLKGNCVVAEFAGVRAGYFKMRSEADEAAVKDAAPAGAGLGTGAVAAAAAVAIASAAFARP